MSSFFCCVEDAQVFFLAIDRNLCSPLPQLLYKVDTQNAGFVGFAGSGILNVFRPRYRAKIFHPIIKRVSVYVIYI